ncbi:MAG: alpha/beta fold hydrolase [Myxococcota bacterium]
MTLPLIPRDVLFGNPDRATPTISPDGRYLAWLAPDEGVLNVWVAPTDDPSNPRAITRDRVRGIRSFAWAYDGAHLLYVQDLGGNEDWHIHAVKVDGGGERDLTPLEGVQARIVGRSRKHPGRIVVGLNDRVPQLHDLWTVDLATGEQELLLENPGFLAFLVDEDFTVPLAITATPDGGMVWYKAQDGDWVPLEDVPQTDALTTAPIQLDGTGRGLYYLDSRGRNTGSAWRLDLDTGEKTQLAEDPKADVSDLMVHPTTKAVQAVASTFERTRWQVLDAGLQPDLDALGAMGGQVEVLSRTDDDTRWTVALVLDNGPIQYLLWDRTTQSATPLFTNRSALEGLTLATMHPVVLKSRDGLDLVSYLTLPYDADPQKTGRPAEPIPMVLLVHGGPWARDEWGYNAYHQWLANRGYAVLSVNFRGSTGFGKAFVNAGDNEWAAKMHNDLLDAVDWAVEQRICPRDRVAIMGGSYGGYATLVGLTFTPDVFACGVDIVGPSSIQTLIESIPEYWKPVLSQLTTRVGDHTTEEGRSFLWSRSPLSKVEQIARPLLIGQGANDPRVKQAESDQIVEAMDRQGIPVTYVLFPDEGHGFARPENSIAFTAVTEAFLAEHLGGRVESFEASLQASTITVPAGASHIPGLDAALPSGG